MVKTGKGTNTKEKTIYNSGVLETFRVYIL